MAWGKINLTAGGGTTYNYKITDYLTEGSIPSSDTANSIAIVTSTAIPSIDSGGIIWKPTQPTFRTNGHSLVTGDVWIIESYASNVPFVAVNGIYVYAVGCFQWDGSSWVERVAKVYYGGAWVAMYLYLYYLTNQCTSVTGGWQARAWAATSGTTAQLPNITVGSDNVLVYFAASTSKAGVYEVINNTDLTPFSTLRFDGYSNANANNFVRLVVTQRNNTYWSTSALSNTSIPTTRGYLDVDISAINTSCDILVGVYTGSTAGAPLAYMYSLRLIP